MDRRKYTGLLSVIQNDFMIIMCKQSKLRVCYILHALLTTLLAYSRIDYSVAVACLITVCEVQGSIPIVCINSCGFVVLSSSLRVVSLLTLLRRHLKTKL